MVNPKFMQNYIECINKELKGMLAGPPAVWPGGVEMDHYKGLASALAVRVVPFMKETYEATEFVFGAIPVSNAIVPRMYFQCAVLNVGGMTYSVLLNRSSDWPTYESVLAYPDLAQRPLILSMWQVLWDRAETNGYSQHAISDTYDNTPSHQILLQADFGDFQVANVQAEVEARTMGLYVYDGGPTPNGHELVPDRHWAADPLFGLTPIPSFPYPGSALVYWDGGPPAFTGTSGIGTTAPPNSNTRPVPGTGPGQNGADPHSYSRKDHEARQQVSDFFDGALGSCTGGGPCFDNNWDGVMGLP